jgi:hypothetical protein
MLSEDRAAILEPTTVPGNPKLKSMSGCHLHNPSKLEGQAFIVGT